MPLTSLFFTVFYSVFSIINFRGPSSEVIFGKGYQTFHFSRIFQISRIVNLQHLLFFSFINTLLMFLEKSEVIFPFAVIKQAQLWHVQATDVRHSSVQPSLRTFQNSRNNWAAISKFLITSWKVPNLIRGTKIDQIRT